MAGFPHCCGGLINSPACLSLTSWHFPFGVKEKSVQCNRCDVIFEDYLTAASFLLLRSREERHRSEGWYFWWICFSFPHVLHCWVSTRATFTPCLRRRPHSWFHCNSNNFLVTTMSTGTFSYARNPYGDLRRERIPPSAAAAETCRGHALELKRKKGKNITYCSCGVIQVFAAVQFLSKWRC